MVLLYWKLRLVSFGEDRFWLPLHQTGNGALNEKDIELLSKGIWTFPPKISGPDGLFIGYMIPSRRKNGISDRALDADMDHETAARVRFYMHQVLTAFLPLHETDCYGMICVDDHTLNGIKVNLPDFRRQKKTFPFHARLLFAVEKEQPVAFHDKQKTFFWSRIVPTIARALPKCLAARMEVVVANRTDGSVFRQLVHRFGFAPDCLPAEFGGSWTVERFHEWQQDRCHLEQKLEGTPAYAAILRAHEEQEKEHNREERKKEYQRQQHRKKMERFERLQATSDACILENKQLRAESARLEQLLGQAKAMVREASNGEELQGALLKLPRPPPPLPPPIAAVRNYKDAVTLKLEHKARQEYSQQRRRRMNRVNSRAKRERRTAERTSLLVSHDAAMLERKQLNAEAQRLQCLRDAAVQVLTSHGLPLPTEWN